MKKIILVLSVLLSMLSLVGVTAASSAADFDGVWENVDAATRGVTKLQIDMSGTTTQGIGVTVQAWGRCHPTDCDWGIVKALAYGPDVSADVVNTAQAVTAIFTTSFNETIMVIHPLPGNELQVEIFTQFTDGSARSDYSNTYTFRHPAEQECIDLSALPIASGPNPLVVQGVSFLVSDYTSTVLPNSTIRTDGGFNGLDAGFTLEITLPAGSQYQNVALTLVQFATAPKIVAFSGGSAVASGTMTVGQKVAETVTLSVPSPVIDRIVVSPPSDETLLLKLCYTNGNKNDTKSSS